MKKVYLFLMVAAFAAAGCTNTGAFLAANQTSVNLGEANYTLVATDIYGEAEAGYIIGVSYSYGAVASSFAIARVEGTGQLYTEALQALWQKFESDHGDVGNRKVALANVRYDADILNLLLYTKVKITVRADVVEFM